MRPVAVVGEFVFGESPLSKLCSDVVRHSRAVRQEVHQALLVDFVLFDDFQPAFIRCFRVVVVEADVVCAERTVVVGVGFVIRDRIELVEPFTPASFEHSNQQLVLVRVVTIGFREGNAVLRIIRQAHAETVGLNPVVGLAKLAGGIRADSRQQSTRWVTGYDIGADRFFQYSKVVPVVKDACLNSVPVFTVLSTRFATNVVVYLGRCQQVAFVCCIDKYPAVADSAAQHSDRGNATVGFGDAVLPVQPLVSEDRDFVFRHEFVKYVFSDVWFEDPHCAKFAVNRRGALPFVSVLRTLLPFPGVVCLIVLPDSVIEVASKSADDGLVSGVRPAEPAA